MKKKKTNLKVILLALLDIVLVGVLCVGIYFTFIYDSTFKKMGYSYSDIKLIRQYGLEEKITEYNQCFSYAINSKDFNEKNVDYYLSFSSPIDYTKIINELSEKYTVEQFNRLKGLLDEDDFISLVDYNAIEDVDVLANMLNNKGYSFETAMNVINNLSKESLATLLSFNESVNPENYIKYIESGYSDEAIKTIYNISAETFDDLAGMKYEELILDLLANEDFKVENLPRYIMYHYTYNWNDPDRAVRRVNEDAEVLTNVDYSDYYDADEEKTVSEYSITMLVNKVNRLSDSYIPENLVELDGEYRGNPQPLVDEAAEAFIKMSNDCLSATGKRIISYSGYRSYATETTNYLNYIANGIGDETSNVDSFASRAGYSEHQTGLALDIAEKDSSFSQFGDSECNSWVEENAHNYGFILRYSSEKNWITGYKYLPYHYRYVGLEAANIIHKYGWCLEEYSLLFEK